MINLFNEKRLEEGLNDEEKEKQMKLNYVNEFTTRGVQYHFHNPAEHTIDGR